MANSFEIKSAQLPLVALLLKSADISQVITDLLAQFGPHGESPDFFDQDALVLDLRPLALFDIGNAIPALLKALHSCRLKPVAFRHASPENRAACLACGLIETSTELTRERALEVPVLQTPVAVETVREVVREVPLATTLVVDKPLRSGQKVYARGADLVVLAMVNMGAEVVADGNIHVYAPLRGKAMAGASGNTEARIFSICMEPELISIAGIYRTSEHPLPEDIQGKPAQVRLSQDGHDKLLFEALNS